MTDAANFWLKLTKKEASTEQADAALNWLASHPELVTGGIGALTGAGLMYNNSRGRPGGKSRDQVAVSSDMAARANKEKNEGRDGEATWWQKQREEAANWAAEHPGAASGVGAGVGAVLGAGAGKMLLTPKLVELQEAIARRGLLR